LIWPTTGDVIGAHDRAVAATGGAAGLRDEGALESAIHRPLASFGGVELYPGLELKVAALIESLIRNHPFVDGNKRTSMLVGLATLRVNGLSVIADDSDIEWVAVAVAERRMDLSALTTWVRRTVNSAQ
jgi:death-on-curing protein